MVICPFPAPNIWHLPRQVELSPCLFWEMWHQSPQLVELLLMLCSRITEQLNTMKRKCDLHDLMDAQNWILMLWHERDTSSPLPRQNGYFALLDSQPHTVALGFEVIYFMTSFLLHLFGAKLHYLIVIIEIIIDFYICPLTSNINKL